MTHPITKILADIRGAQSQAARERLTALRHHLGMTQRQFAAAVGRSVDWVRSVEIGRATASPAIAEAAERLLVKPPVEKIG